MEYRSPISGALIPRGKPFEQGNEQRERARIAGKKSGEARRKRKTLREDFLTLLASLVEQEDGTKKRIQEMMAEAIVARAVCGDVRAAEYIRDTIGEKPVESVAINAPDPAIMAEVKAYLDGLGD